MLQLFKALDETESIYKPKNLGYFEASDLYEGGELVLNGIDYTITDVLNQTSSIWYVYVKESNPII